MNFNQISCFIHLAETLNFSETAKRMDLTQPAVTKIIKQLETELEASLFHRNTRGVSLTRAGTLFYDDMKDVLLKTNLTIERTRRQSQQDQQMLSIGFTGTKFEELYLPRIIRRFRESAPETQVILRNFVLNQETHDLLTQKFNLVLTSNEEIGQQPNIRYAKVLDGRYVCVVPQDHPFADKPEISFEDLAGQTLILFNPSQSPYSLKKLQEQLLEQPEIAMFLYADSISIIHTLIKSETGISVLPDFVTSDREEGLRLIPFASELAVNYGIGYAADRSASDVQKFIRVFEQVIQELRQGQD